MSRSNLQKACDALRTAGIGEPEESLIHQFCELVETQESCRDDNASRDISHQIFGIMLAIGGDQGNPRHWHSVSEYVYSYFGHPFREYQEPIQQHWLQGSPPEKKDPPPPDGWLYVLSNPEMPGLVKVGFTRTSVEQRIKNLSAATAVPAPFQEVWSHWFFDCEAAEAAAHEHFKDCRSERREFFRADAWEVVRFCQSLAAEEVFQ